MNQTTSPISEPPSRTPLGWYGVAVAVEDLLEPFTSSGNACERSIDLGPDDLPEWLETTVYRIVQESLSNVRRHSGAGRVPVAEQTALDPA